MAEVYGIYSARDGNVRYVGLTVGTRWRRFQQHKRNMWFDHPELSDWAHNEWRHGYPVEFALLQMCSNEVAEQVAGERIKKFPNLFNKRKLINSYHGIKPPKVPEIDAYMRGNSFNHEGHVGVHYSIGWDRFSVLFFGSGGIEWLIGDERPGLTANEGGNIWFSDLARALRAREQRRWWDKDKNWPPDKEL